MNRRTMLASAASLPAVAVGLTPAPAMTAPAIDPVFAARAAWQEADNAYEAAYNRAALAGGDQRVAIPSATGGERFTISAHMIDEIIKHENMRCVFINTPWHGKPSRSAATLTDDQRAAAAEWTPPDAEALKADLAKRKSRYAAAKKAENVEALEKTSMKLWHIYLNTHATTLAGIAMKLREIYDKDRSDEVIAAIADLDRMAWQGEAIPLQIIPATDHNTPVSRLWDEARERLQEANEQATNLPDDESNNLYRRTFEAEVRMVQAVTITPRDMAMKIWTVREHLENSGILGETLLKEAAALIGPDAIKDTERDYALKEAIQ